MELPWLARSSMERLGPPYWTPGPVRYRCISYLMNGMVLEMILFVEVFPPPFLVNARLLRHHSGGWEYRICGPESTAVCFYEILMRQFWIFKLFLNPAMLNARFESVEATFVAGTIWLEGAVLAFDSVCKIFEALIIKILCFLWEFLDFGHQPLPCAALRAAPVNEASTSTRSF